MNNNDEQPSGPAKKSERRERLAENLRANLKRRKAQTRARAGEPAEQKPDPGCPDISNTPRR